MQPGARGFEGPPDVVVGKCKKSIRDHNTQRVQFYILTVMFFSKVIQLFYFTTMIITNVSGVCNT